MQGGQVRKIWTQNQNTHTQIEHLHGHRIEQIHQVIHGLKHSLNDASKLYFKRTTISMYKGR